MVKHDYGLKQISIGLLLILGIMLLVGCDSKEDPIVLQSDPVIVTPEKPTEAPADENKYTEDRRKLPTLKKKYQ